MLRYTLRRLAWLPVILFIISILVFGFLRAFQDPAEAVAGQGATEQDLEELRMEFGLKDPLHEQYFNYMGDVLRGDFGREYRSEKPVGEEFMRRFRPSAEIIGMALFVSIVFGISFGVVSAMYRNSPIDYSVRIFAVAGSSIPEFFLLTLMIIVPAYLWNYSMPVGGYQPFLEDPMRYIQHMGPPALIVGIAGSAGLMRLTRTTMLEVLRADYLRTAHAKGLRQRTIILTHAMKNAGTPIVTAVGTSFITIFGGSIIVERILSIQGLGEWFFTAALIRDFPVVQFLALYTITVVVIINLIVDLSYGFIDPRVRYS
jgi:peptide/nickel transport system permease protein